MHDKIFETNVIFDKLNEKTQQKIVVHTLHI